MEKQKGVCLHDGGRRADGTWGGCLLAKHDTCKACPDAKIVPPAKAETQRHK
jgi:hypothetical protein